MDQHRVPRATLRDLDMDRIREHIAEALARGRYTGTDDPIPFLLQHQALVDDGHESTPTAAGVLMFGTDPQRLMPHAMVDLARFQGTKSVSYEVLDFQKGIGGRLTEQIDVVERYLWQTTRHGFRLGAGAQRIEEHEYTRSVLREVSVNAIAHRDYAQAGSVVRISVFRDRIEWVSPGALPPGVTIPTILRSQTARNPAILTLLYQAGYVEAFGMGLDTVFEAMEEEGLPPPELYETPISFSVTVMARPREHFMEHAGAMDADVLSEAQQQLYELIVERGSLSVQEAEVVLTGRSRRSIQRDLSELVAQKLIVPRGAARALRYLPTRRSGR